MLFFYIAQYPYIGGNSSIVKNIIGQLNDTFQQIIFQYVLANTAFAAARISSKQSRTIVDGSNTATTVFWVFHFRKHMEHKHQLSVIASGSQARFFQFAFEVFNLQIKTSVFYLYFFACAYIQVVNILLPSRSIRRIGEHKIEFQIRVKTVFAQVRTKL